MRPSTNGMPRRSTRRVRKATRTTPRWPERHGRRSSLAASEPMCSMASTLGRRAPSQGEDMKLWQVGVCAYGALYFVLAGAMEVDNLSQGYPIVYIACSML